MVKINIRQNEPCEAQPQLLWDHVWVQEPLTHLTAQGGFADWAVSAKDEPGNIGGLQAKAALHTATLILLFTDKRAPTDAALDSDDPRGWWGDSILFEGDQFERELGSHLWMLERGTLSDETGLIAQEMCEQALSVLVEQGMVAETQVEVEVRTWEGMLLIGVRHFSMSGATLYDQKFEVLWGQTVRWPTEQQLIPTRSYSSAI